MLGLIEQIGHVTGLVQQVWYELQTCTTGGACARPYTTNVTCVTTLYNRWGMYKGLYNRWGMNYNLYNR